jgi:hypothetical protein
MRARRDAEKERPPPMPRGWSWFFFVVVVVVVLLLPPRALPPPRPTQPVRPPACPLRPSPPSPPLHQCEFADALFFCRLSFFHAVCRLLQPSPIILSIIIIICPPPSPSTLSLLGARVRRHPQAHHHHHHPLVLNLPPRTIDPGSLRTFLSSHALPWGPRPSNKQSIPFSTTPPPPPPDSARAADVALEPRCSDPNPLCIQRHPKASLTPPPRSRRPPQP